MVSARLSSKVPSAFKEVVEKLTFSDASGNIVKECRPGCELSDI